MSDYTHKEQIFRIPILIGILSTWLFSCTNTLQNDIESSFLEAKMATANTINKSLGYEKSFHYLDSSYASLPKENRYDTYLIFDFKRNVYFSDIQDYAQALLYADSQLVAIKSIPLQKDIHKSMVSGSYMKKGLVLFNLKRYDEAYECYYKSKESLIGIKDSCIIKSGEASLYDFFANIKYKQNDFIEAALNYKKTYFVDMGCDHNQSFDYRKQGMLDNIALSYSHAGLDDSAYHYYTKAFEWIENYKAKYPYDSLGVGQAKAVVYGNLASLYIKKNKLDSAEILLKKSIAINKEGEKMDAQLTQIKLINLYLLENRNEEAHKLLLETKASLDTLKNESAFLKWLLVKQKYFDVSHQTDSAYKTLQTYYFVRDSINTKDKYLKETDLFKELKTKDQIHQINLLQKQNQLTYLYLIVATILFLLGGIIAYLIWRNMKQEKLRNSIVALANTQLEISNKNYGRIMKVMAHDFKTPLAGMTSILGLLNKKEKYSEEGKELMELLLSSCKESLIMIDDLLNTAFEKQPEQLKKETIDINQLLEQCVALMQFKATTKKQQIILQTKENVSIAINYEKIWRMMLNLLRNAIKYSLEGQTITVSTKKQNNHLIISVKDSGIGIPQNILPKIFDMFTDAIRPGTHGERPVGIGLSICKQIAELHNGKIWVESVENNGSTFYVELPIA